MPGETTPPVRTSGWRTGVLLAAAATVVSLAIVAAAGEWAVRRRERTRTTAPGTMSMLFYRHSRLMHGLERGMDYFGWVHVGRQGFRGAREVSEARPDSVYRIIAVGGSTTFDGNTSGDTSTWSARLEQILDSIGAPTRFEVLNAGVPGFQVFDDLIRLQLELHRYQPDLLILYQGHNDLFNTLSRAGQPVDQRFDSRPLEIPTVYPWARWLERHSLLYHKLRSRWEAIRFRAEGSTQGARPRPATYEASVARGLADFERNVRLFLAVAAALDIDVLVPQAVYAAESSPDAGADEAVTAMWTGAVPYAPLHEVRQVYARVDSIMRVTAARGRATYVPATDPALWLRESYTVGDPIHFNDDGAWRFARHLAAAITQLPRDQSPAGATP